MSLLRRQMPFSDPAAELGDQVKIGDQVHSSIYSMDATFDIGYANTISAPTNTEATRQYPYLTQRERTGTRSFWKSSARTIGGVAMSADAGLVVTKTGSAAKAMTAGSQYHRSPALRVQY